MSDHPENQAVEREKQEAADEELAEREPARESEVDRHPETDQSGNANVGVRKQQRPELVDEQCVANRFADDETGNDQKEIGEKEQSSFQLAAPKIQEAFEPLQHRVPDRSLPRMTGRPRARQEC